MAAALAAGGTRRSHHPSAATGAAANANRNMITESQLRIDSLAASLRRMADSTSEITALSDGLTRRARHLDSLTSPASETSAMLTQSAHHLSSTLGLMKDAREKFDTVQDCEPALQRLRSGVQEAQSLFEAAGGISAANANANSAATGTPREAPNLLTGAGSLTEQDVYAAVDSMDIVRDAYAYFLKRSQWRSAPSALGGLERAHALGVDAMCLLIDHHLRAGGAAVRWRKSSDKGGGSSKKKGGGGGGGIPTSTSRETAAETRLRLSSALQNRDLMTSVGECEECLPLESRPVRELRAVFECLGGAGGDAHLGVTGAGAHLGPDPLDMVRRARVRPEMAKVVRTEKVGSGSYCNLVSVSQSCSLMECILDGVSGYLGRRMAGWLGLQKLVHHLFLRVVTSIASTYIATLRFVHINHNNNHNDKQ
jgi:exocyst complex protein 7